jgi:hypothetical protein
MKYKILLTVFFTFCLLNNSAFSNNKNLNKESLNGIWKITLQPEDDKQINAKLNISYSEIDDSYSGTFKVFIKKSKLEDFTYDKKHKNLKFKVNMIFAKLNFDLYLKDGNLIGPVIGSDGVKGKVTGIRKL